MLTFASWCVNNLHDIQWLTYIIQLWEDLGNWHSALRKKARVQVSQRYKWDTENRRDVNIRIAEDLLGDRGAFLRNGVDEDVSGVYTCMCLSQLCSGTYQQPGAPCAVRSGHRFLLHRRLVSRTAVSGGLWQ